MKKEREVVEEDWSSLLVISRLLAEDDWLDIKEILEDHFEAYFVIIPLMGDKRLWKFED